jgi:hypothetical protein
MPQALLESTAAFWKLGVLGQVGPNNRRRDRTGRGIIRVGSLGFEDDTVGGGAGQDVSHRLGHLRVDSE